MKLTRRIAAKQFIVHHFSSANNTTRERERKTNSDLEPSSSQPISGGRRSSTPQSLRSLSSTPPSDLTAFFWLI
ncbi:hypothetical protein P8452_64521 [Trifolium repens]|nr:hypothetical protein P8452_64521 [Trifolium repens]